MTRPAFISLGLMIAGIGLSVVPASAQFRLPKAEVTPRVQRQAIHPGQTVSVELAVELPEDIHVQSNDPKDPFVIPTTLSFTPPEGVVVEEIVYPESIEFLLEGWDEPLLVFENEFTIVARLALDPNVPTGVIVVPGSLLYQPCDDKVCFPPATAEVEWRMTVEPTGNR